MVLAVSAPATASPTTLAPEVAAYFDANPSPSDGYAVVGSTTPPSWSWGEIELLEGHQRFRTAHHNVRTEKLRSMDTYQSTAYPLRTYFGALNQQIVDAFDLAYDDPCANGSGTCEVPGPTRPEARYVLLHKGPATATGTCQTDKPPALLVHGAMQDANVWLAPNGRSATGATYEGATPATGLVQHLEDRGRCVYAVTFGNFHGDNYEQATHLANATDRILALQPDAERIDLVAWSKGVLAADAWLTDANSWAGFDTTRRLEAVAAASAEAVPSYDDQVRAYVALSGPHRGLDLNFRHPIHDLVILSTASNAPVGRGPVAWTWFSAMQCVTFGPSTPWFPNPYAESVCDGSGETWMDYWRRIHVSNLTGLGPDGEPLATSTLEQLNVSAGVPAASFRHDEYDLSMFGSVDADGVLRTAYPGQLQAAADQRPHVPVPTRGSSWSNVDPDVQRYFPWLRTKLVYNPFNPWVAAGYLDSSETACRTTAFAPMTSPCVAYHYQSHANSEGRDALTYHRYRLFDSAGIDVAEELGGRFVERLAERSLDDRLSSLLVVHGTAAGAGDPFETDGMACPTCPPGGDGVLFEHSIAARDQLTQHWSAAKRSADSLEVGVPVGHLEVGVDPNVLDVVADHLDDLDAAS